MAGDTLGSEQFHNLYTVDTGVLYNTDEADQAWLDAAIAAAEERPFNGPTPSQDLPGIEDINPVAAAILALVYDVRDATMAAADDAERDTEQLRQTLEERLPSQAELLQIVETLRDDAYRIRDDILDQLEGIQQQAEELQDDAMDIVDNTGEDIAELRDEALRLVGDAMDEANRLITILQERIQHYRDQVQEDLDGLTELLDDLEIPHIEDFPIDPKDPLGDLTKAQQFSLTLGQIGNWTKATLVQTGGTTPATDPIPVPSPMRTAPDQAPINASTLPTLPAGSRLLFSEEFEGPLASDAWNTAPSIQEYSWPSVQSTQASLHDPTILATQDIPLPDLAVQNVQITWSQARLPARTPEDTATIARLLFDDASWLQLTFSGDDSTLGITTSTGQSMDQLVNPQLAAWRHVTVTLTGELIQVTTQGLSVAVPAPYQPSASQLVIEFTDTLEGPESLRDAVYEVARDYLFVSASASGANQAPAQPARPTGAATTPAGQQQGYQTTAVDPDLDDLRYYFDWGDGSGSWTLWKPSGSAAYAWHTWSTPGTYTIHVIAQDKPGDYSPWSNPRVVSVESVVVRDAYEPDDSMNQARPIVVGDQLRSQEHSISPAGEDDHVRFQAEPGQKYTFYTSGSLDLVGRLYTVGGLLLQTDSYGGSESNFRIDFSPPVAADYILRITAQDVDAVGDYGLHFLHENDIPGKPALVSGPLSVDQGDIVEYRFKATDPNGDDVKMLINWGDGTQSQTEWVASGQTVSIEKMWNWASSAWPVTAKAQDTAGNRGLAKSFSVHVEPWKCKTHLYNQEACDLVILRGYAGDDPSSDVSMQGFSGLRSEMEKQYGAGNVDRYGFYGGDCSAEDSTAVPSNHALYWTHSEFNAEDHTTTSGCGSSAGIKRHTRDTPIEHMAFHVAHYLDDRYGDQNEPFDVAAHSMGGLVIRFAAGATRAFSDEWPAELSIEDVVTMGSPHNGGKWACQASGAEYLFGYEFPRQAKQMCQGNGFIKTIRDNYSEDKADGSLSLDTEWTTIGSADDEWVTAKSSRDMIPEIYVIYFDDDKIHHSDYYQPSGFAKPYTYRVLYAFPQRDPVENGPSPTYEAPNAAHPVKIVHDALITNLL